MSGSNELTEFYIAVSGWSFVETEMNAITRVRIAHNGRDIKVNSIVVDERFDVNEVEAS